MGTEERGDGPEGVDKGGEGGDGAVDGRTWAVGQRGRGVQLAGELTFTVFNDCMVLHSTRSRTV